MSDTHSVVFRNLRDAKTGEIVRLKISNDLVYEWRMLFIKEIARQSAQKTLARIRRT